ncbi:MAG: ATP-binding protein [Acidimicrobiales bacterium]
MGGGDLTDRGVTRREAEVFSALADRLTNADIAARLYVSERTVESHISSLLRKLHAANRVELGDLAKETLGGLLLGRPPLPSALELLAEPETYCGRSNEQKRLRALWQQAAAGQLLVAVVAGEAGIGKTRLVAEVAADIHRTGARVLLGSCFEDLQLPYEPFVQAINDDASGLPDIELRRRAGSAAERLARIVPELAGRVQAPVAAAVPDPSSARTELFAGLHGYLCRSADAGPLLFVVEDMHWATPTTLGAIRHIARVGGHVPVLLILTTRNVQPDLHPSLSVFLSDLARLPAVEHLELAGLDEPDVVALLECLGGRADAAAVIAETGGNPLFIREIASGQVGALGRSLPSLLARRYALLDRDDLPVIDLAAVLGSEFDANDLAAACDSGVTEVLESLERAIAAGLIAASPDRPGHFSFVHALFRAARYDDIPPSRRVRLHHQALLALEARPRDDRVIAELARHACIAAALAGASVALDYATRAAVSAEQSLALDEAADHYRHAIAVAELLDPPDPTVALRLTVRLGEVLQGAGSRDARRLLLTAAQTARSLGDTTALAEVGWAVVKYGAPRTPGNRDSEFAALMEDGLRGLGPEPSVARARTLAALSEDLCFTDPVRAWELVHEARDMARQLGDPATLGHVLASYRFSARTPENADARHPTADELIEIGRVTGDVTFTIVGLSNRVWSYREEGNLGPSDDAIAAGAALFRDRTLPPAYVAAHALLRATRAALGGNLVDAEREAEGVWSLANAGLDPGHWYGPALLMIRHQQGRLGELVAVIEAAAAQPGIGDTYRAALAAAYAHAGRLDEARGILREFGEKQFAAVPRNMTWLAGMTGLCEAAELTGDAEAAAVVVEQLVPFSGRIADLPQAVIAPVDLALAQATLTAGDPARAESFASLAVTASRMRKTPVFLGRELVRLAAARRALRAEADVAALVEEALEIARATGAQVIRRDAEHYGLVAPA